MFKPPFKKLLFYFAKMAVGTWSLKHNGKKERKGAPPIFYTFLNCAFSKILLFLKFLYFTQKFFDGLKTKLPQVKVRMIFHFLSRKNVLAKI
jgi:hypothetical protein